MKFLIKKIYIIFLLLSILLFEPKVFAKESNTQYTKENISNYFFGVISANQDYNNEAFKHLKKVKSLRNRHSRFNIAFIRTLILLDKFEQAFTFSKSHIEIINPKILMLLGSTALNTLIGNQVVISKARGQWIQKEIGLAKPWIIASFHPAFLMRQPEQKKLAWIDLKMVRDKSKILKI